MEKQMLLKEIIEEVDFLNEDHAIPKNVRLILNTIEERLSKRFDTVELSSILYELEDVTTASNMPQFCRSSVWSLINKLEALKENMK
jgi:uncharacterized protein (UPF0147 family)